jgi:hypothetical protein
MNTSKTPPDSKTSYAKAFFDSIDPTRTLLRTFDSISRRRGLLGLGRELDLAAQFQSLCVEN